MPATLATVRDVQSAEYHKSRALAEPDPRVALPIWQTARRLDPESTALIAHEALALRATGQLDAAITLLTAALPARPRSVHLHNLLGVCLSDRGHYPDAARLFRHVAALDPDHPSAAASLAEIGARRGRPAPEGVRRAIEAAIAEAARRPRPTLATCLIVRDEEAFLADALASVASVSDQLVVVDTGSVDRTVEIARAAGATVGFFAWTGDFSAARNASLDLATTDWILVLDADERLTARSRSTLRAVIEEFHGDPDPRVVCVRVNNYTRDGRFIGDGFSGRLFPNRADLRFEGRVHEQVGGGRADVATDYRLDIEFDHFGADPEVMREKAKDARNLALLEARLAEAPDDLLTWFYLASQHWVGGRRDAALAAFERVVELYERDPSRYGLGVRQVPVPYSYVGLVRGHLDAGRVDEALAFGARGGERFADNPDLAYHHGLAWLARGALDEARAALVRAAETPVTGYALIGMHDRAIGAWKAQKAVADIDFEREDFPAAHAGYAAVWPALPADHPERVTVGARLVELASAIGDLDALPERTRAYLALRPGEHPVAVQVAARLTAAGRLQAAYDLLTGLFADRDDLRAELPLIRAIAAVAEQAGEDAEALRWYEHAVSLGPADPAFWLDLARLLARTGDAAAAREAMTLAKSLMG
ncbi:MAG: glycosyltransferase [Myxococcales bacterium]|nr:glycosyltransferase [Myxococcales bacterium]